MRWYLSRCRFLACLSCLDADIDKEWAGRGGEGDHEARAFQDVGDRVALAVHNGGNGGIDGHAHLLELRPRRSGNHVGQLPNGIEDVSRHLVVFLAQHIGNDLTDAFLGEAQRQGPDGVARDPDDAGDIPGGRFFLFQRGLARNGIHEGHLFQDLQCAVQEGVDVFNVHIRCFGSCSGSNPREASTAYWIRTNHASFQPLEPMETSRQQTANRAGCDLPEVSCVMGMKKEKRRQGGNDERRKAVLSVEDGLLITRQGIVRKRKGSCAVGGLALWNQSAQGFA